MTIFLRLALAGILFAAPLPAFAQLAGSPGYTFLQAVRNDKGQEVIDILSKPGNRIINTQDPSTGEGALAIVVKRGDAKYVRYFLAQDGVDPNIRDKDGNTPMLLAVQYGYEDLVPILIAGKANPNIGNSGGDTPLILAVQRRNQGLVRVLLDSGANPDQSDIRAGKSARDYAMEDTRSPAIAKMFEGVPKKARRAVSGPTL
ncbi:ankyrin repeat domain-containing protein [Sphingomonas sp.]|jgi:ankyrin repeat protein|uniref:ankyrin repeat domain-containing protein n=1 Tax=Sphingomonas sp. TaxID=28214 RepID=UPI002E2F61CD|nr:ankyrin repeat domain-containing protein [Sphingomonas sp.]HEX4695142.1 ankyrin repeat domain-containing protein [Sphingomonas sp.]